MAGVEEGGGGDKGVEDQILQDDSQPLLSEVGGA